MFDKSLKWTDFESLFSFYFIYAYGVLGPCIFISHGTYSATFDSTASSANSELEKIITIFAF